MVAPDPLLKFDSANTRRDRAALAAVEPAVRAPGQRVGNRMGVFHPEAAETDDGITVRNVILVAVGVEQQVRNVEHEHTPVTKGQTSRQIQAADKIVRLVRSTVPISVFENRDAVGAFGSARRRLRDALIGRARPAIHNRAFQPRRVRALDVLHDPKPAAVVKFDAHRLHNHGLARDQLDLEVGLERHVARCFVWRIALSDCGQ